MSSPQLTAVLQRAQTLGHIGPGSVQEYVEHAQCHLRAAQPGPATHWCDLGSGGGLPGLVVAIERPDLRLTLIDRSASRTEFLAQALEHLDLKVNVEVVNGDAAVLAHEARFRGAFHGVFSRSFGPPATTAECAIGFLMVDGYLVVSEPPATTLDRWPSEELKSLGYGEVEFIEGPPRFARLGLVTPPGPETPRAWKHVSKRPLF